MEKTDYKIALMIDSENVNPRWIEKVIDEAAKYGQIIVSLFYGDVKKINRDWEQVAIDHAIRPMHQYAVAKQKNAADLAMALDAMELMYRGTVDAFFIVSSDSDFTPLAMKLKTGGMMVIGFGHRDQVTSAYRNACTKFMYFEYLGETADEPEVTDIQPVDIANVIEKIVSENGENNRLLMSRLGIILNNKFSDFDPRNYGSANLTSLIHQLPNLDVSFDHDKKANFVRVKPHFDLDAVKEAILELLLQNKSKEMALPKLKQEIDQRYPTFSHQVYGFTKFSGFVASLGSFSIHQNKVRLKRQRN